MALQSAIMYDNQGHLKQWSTGFFEGVKIKISNPLDITNNTINITKVMKAILDCMTTAQQKITSNNIDAAGQNAVYRQALIEIKDILATDNCQQYQGSNPDIKAFYYLWYKKLVAELAVSPIASEKVGDSTNNQLRRR